MTDGSPHAFNAATPDEPAPVAARIRAARAFAGLGQRDLASALGLTLATYKRIEQGTRPASEEEQAKVAAMCGVPQAFMTDGFDVVLAASPGDPARARVIQTLRAGLADETRRRQRIDRALVAARRALDGVVDVPGDGA